MFVFLLYKHNLEISGPGLVIALFCQLPENPGLSCSELRHGLKGFASNFMSQNRACTSQKVPKRRRWKEGQNRSASSFLRKVSRSFQIIFLSIVYLTPTYPHIHTWISRKPCIFWIGMYNFGKMEI